MGSFARSVVIILIIISGGLIPMNKKCPRCKSQYDGYWQECDNCIERVYPEK